MPHEPQIKPEAIALMNALLARPDIVATASKAFKHAYPDAPDAMIESAVLHVISEGIEATVDWLAAIERFLRDPSEGLDYGAVWHVIYHLYNWQQFQALLPLGRYQLQECLNDVQHFLAEEDHDAAQDTIKRLLERIDGDAPPPSIG